MVPYPVGSETDIYDCEYLDDLPGIYCNWRTFVDFIITRIENDGVLSKETQAGYPGAQRKWMIGSNHTQSRNDNNTKLRLNELFQGDFGNFFFTNEK